MRENHSKVFCIHPRQGYSRREPGTHIHTRILQSWCEQVVWPKGLPMSLYVSGVVPPVRCVHPAGLVSMVKNLAWLAEKVDSTDQLQPFRRCYGVKVARAHIKLPSRKDRALRDVRTDCKRLDSGSRPSLYWSTQAASFARPSRSLLHEKMRLSRNPRSPVALGLGRDRGSELSGQRLIDRRGIHQQSSRQCSNTYYILSNRSSSNNLRPHYSEKLATLRDSRRALVVLLLVTSAMLFSPRSALPKAAAVVQDCNPNAITDGLSDPAALAFDLSGDLWVANAGSNNVVEFKSSPNRVISPIVSKAITNGISSPQVLAFDSLGNLWIANSGSDSIVEYNATSLASPNPSPTKTITSLSFPTGLAIDSAGDLWVSSPQIASILEFNTTSLASNSPTVSKEVGIRAPLSPSGLAFDSRGNLWVSGSTANPPEIWEFDRTSLASSNTTVSKTIGAVEGPFSLTFDSSGTLWVANLGGFIFQFNSTSLKSINPTVSQTLIMIDFFHAFAGDSYGDLWVINGSSSLSDSNAVLEFTPTSLSADTPPFSWKASKTITDGLGFPRGLAFDNSGNLWAVRVISPENSNLMEFNATSLASTRPITSKTVGIPGDSGGLAFDSLGNMWLTSGLDLLEIDRTSLGTAGPTISKTIRAGTNSSYLG